MTDGDRARVRELLGREPQGRFDVVVRDAGGDPVVLRNDPFLDDGTPMPTRYWLVAPDEIRRVGHLEAAGGVNAAESAIAGAELAAAHDRYAAERDAAIPALYEGPRPSGGVGGTRLGVKCLHAHWAWHLAGGDDPVGRWIAERFELVGIDVGDDRVHVRFGQEALAEIPWGASNLSAHMLAEHDPPRPEALTNALGAVTDHIDDVVRDHPTFVDATAVEFRGATIESLARLELGTDQVDDDVVLDRDAAEEIFRIVATEPSRQRAHNPGLPSDHVGDIVATCCIVLAFMRRLHLDRVVLAVEPSGESGGR